MSRILDEEMDSMRWGMREMGSSVDGEFTRLIVDEMES